MIALQSSPAQVASHNNVVAHSAVSDAAVFPVVHCELLASEDDRPLAPARGIILAILISAPIWALIALAVYELA